MGNKWGLIVKMQTLEIPCFTLIKLILGPS